LFIVLILVPINDIGLTAYSKNLFAGYYFAHSFPSGVRRHKKYASSTLSDAASGTEPICGVFAKCITAGLALLNADHAGTPALFG
jgi:hypothetical protein